MKILLTDIKKHIPLLSWSAEELAEKLSLIGHETEVAGESLDITLTANRKDCQQLPYLLFDLMAVYPELGDNKTLVEIKPGKTIKVTSQQVNNLLGSAVTKEQYKGLERLGFIVNDSEVIAPDFRVDVFEAADIAEEVFRLYGAKAINVAMLSKDDVVESAQYQRQQSIRVALVSAGLNETRTVSFTSSGEVALKNAFSADLPYLRPNLLEGLLQTLTKNPFMRRAAFFEIGNTFTPEEETYIGLIFSGNKNKDKLEKLLDEALGVAISLEQPAAELLHRYNVKQPHIFYGEVALDKVQGKQGGVVKTDLPNFKGLSKFPPLVRDISVTTKFDAAALHQEFSELLMIEKIDSYTHPDTKKTTDTYRLIFQKHDESFTQEEISRIDKKIEERFFDTA